MVVALAVALAAATNQVAAVEPCAADNRTRVAANDECLVIKTYGKSAERTSLIIFIHGTVTAAGLPTTCIRVFKNSGRRESSPSA